MDDDNDPSLEGLPPALARHIRESARWRKDMDEWRKGVTEELRANTTTCNDVRAWQTTFNVGTLTAKWVGGMALVGSALIGLWLTVKHALGNGGPPPGIGPQ